MRYPVLSLCPRAPRVRFSATNLVALCVALFFAGSGAAQTSGQNVVLTFEGLQNVEEVLNYYDGGFGSLGSGPGPNYGITFGSGTYSKISVLDGGTGNFSGNPSGITSITFLSGSSVIMNVPAGFTTGFSFYYSAPFYTGSVTVYDANNNVLQVLALPLTGTGCDNTGEPYDCWKQIGVAFSGVATSVDFSGSTDYIGFDNITLGASIPGSGCGLIINTNSLASGLVGMPYSQVLSASNCTPPYKWSSAVSPSWATVTAQTSTTGVLSGKPTAAGTFPVTLTVTDSSPVPVSYTTPKPLLLVIGQALTITTTSLAGGTAGVQYNQTLKAAGGTLPYNWTASGLPGWAQVTDQTAANGLLSGMPSAGTSNVIVTVTDSSSPKLSYSTPPLPLVIVAAVTPLSLTTSSLSGGTVNIPYDQPLIATGGTPPYTWIASGLPGWAQVTNSNGAGAIIGNPTAAGTSSVTLTVTDSSNPTLSASSPSLPLTIIPPTLGITTNSLASGVVGTVYNQPLNASGGTPPYTWNAAGLPGWAQVTNSNGAGAITGKPTAAGTSSVMLTVTDSSSPPLSMTSAAYPLVINSPSAPSLQIAPSVSQITAITNSVSVTVTLSSPAPADLTATLTLSFAGSAAGLPSGSYADPGLQFGQGGTITTLVIPSGSSSASLPANDAIQVGSVAGTITVTITGLTETLNGQPQPLVLPSPNPNTTITIPANAPSITSVQIIDVTATGFTVDIVAVSVTRDLSGVNLTFSPAQGATLNGTSFSYSGSQMSTPASSWFSSQSGLNAGGAFDLQIPFTFSGDTSAISSVSVTLVNSAGTSSAAPGVQ